MRACTLWQVNSLFIDWKPKGLINDLNQWDAMRLEAATWAGDWLIFVVIIIATSSNDIHFAWGGRTRQDLHIHTHARNLNFSFNCFLSVLIVHYHYDPGWTDHLAWMVCRARMMMMLPQFSYAKIRRSLLFNAATYDEPIQPNQLSLFEARKGEREWSSILHSKTIDCSINWGERVPLNSYGFIFTSKKCLSLSQSVSQSIVGNPHFQKRAW